MNEGYPVHGDRGPLDELLGQIVAAQVRNGFGDLGAPLAEGEQVHAANACPHGQCDWLLPVEWRRGAQTTRLRGINETDRLIQAHLEQHVVENWNRT